MVPTDEELVQAITKYTKSQELVDTCEGVAEEASNDLRRVDTQCQRDRVLLVSLLEKCENHRIVFEGCRYGAGGMVLSVEDVVVERVVQRGTITGHLTKEETE